MNQEIIQTINYNVQEIDKYRFHDVQNIIEFKYDRPIMFTNLKISDIICHSNNWKLYERNETISKIYMDLDGLPENFDIIKFINTFNDYLMKIKYIDVNESEKDYYLDRRDTLHDYELSSRLYYADCSNINRKLINHMNYSNVDDKIQLSDSNLYETINETQNESVNQTLNETQNESVNETLNQTQNIMPSFYEFQKINLTPIYLITRNDNSSHHNGISYHIILNYHSYFIDDIVYLMANFVVLHSEYKPYIDLSVYSFGHYLRCILQHNTEREKPIKEDDFHCIYKIYMPEYPCIDLLKLNISENVLISLSFIQANKNGWPKEIYIPRINWSYEFHYYHGYELFFSDLIKELIEYYNYKQE